MLGRTLFVRVIGCVLAALLDPDPAAARMSLLEPLVRSVIFQPSPGVDLTPEQLGLRAEEVFLETADGVRIHGFWLPAEEADRAVLFLHGNAGNASHRLPMAARLRALGAHVLLLDYRGYGRSEGSPSEDGLYADARAGLDHLTGARGLDARRVVVFGRSLGAVVAVDLARGRPFAGVILESAFPNAEEVARAAFGWPLSLLARGRFDALSRIGAVEAPLLFLHGDSDRIVPPSLGRALHEAAPEPKTFELVSGAGHNDTAEVGGESYFRRIGGFLDRCAPPRQADSSSP
ncbi:MAG TPA: alpha/beta hydrolase [Myxococcota bacterium]|nr:alpha/beta hydrolase [Myxococcota bacterium]